MEWVYTRATCYDRLSVALFIDALFLPTHNVPFHSRVLVPNFIRARTDCGRKIEADPGDENVWR
jgi:hypothetical protein